MVDRCAVRTEKAHPHFKFEIIIIVSMRLQIFIKFQKRNRKNLKPHTLPAITMHQNILKIR